MQIKYQNRYIYSKGLQFNLFTVNKISSWPSLLGFLACEYPRDPILNFELTAVLVAIRDENSTRTLYLARSS